MARKKKLTTAKVGKLVEAIAKEIDAISDYTELNTSLVNEIRQTLLFYIEQQEKDPDSFGQGQDDPALPESLKGRVASTFKPGHEPSDAQKARHGQDKGAYVHTEVGSRNII
jgi:hypothetical protein